MSLDGNYTTSHLYQLKDMVFSIFKTPKIMVQLSRGPVHDYFGGFTVWHTNMTPMLIDETVLSTSSFYPWKSPA